MEPQNSPSADRVDFVDALRGFAGVFGANLLVFSGYADFLPDVQKEITTPVPTKFFTASAWLRRFRFGPAEWLWRSFTYWKIQPLRRTVPALGT